MELHSHHHRRHRDFTGRAINPNADPVTVHAALTAISRAEVLLHEGRLITPGEALALAGPEARHDETLYSVARAVAWETGGELEEILCRLGERFPELT